MPQGIVHIAKRLSAILEDGESDLPGTFRQLPARLGDHLKGLGRQVVELEQQIQRWHRENEFAMMWNRSRIWIACPAFLATTVIQAVGEMVFP